METFLVVPVRIADTFVGNLYLCDNVAGSSFTEQDAALVATSGRVGGLLIDKEQ